MFCAISGTVPEEPVVSVKSGHLYEKRLVEKYIAETGKCPATGEALTTEDLLPLQASKTVKPRTTPATSIPGLLGLFHDEWDALMLETHSVRQNLHSVRQELSHALYQHDAACRVIARLLRERDEAREALNTIRENVKAELAAKRGAEEAAAGEAAESAAKRAKTATGISDAIMEDLLATNATLSKARKKRVVPDSLASPEEVASYKLRGSFALHKTTAGGILGIAERPGGGDVVATAGADGSVQVFDVAAQRQLASLLGHGKRVTGLGYATPSLLVSCSADKTVRLWSAPGAAAGTDTGAADAGAADDLRCAAVLSDHGCEVVGLSVHPSGRYFVSAAADAGWAFWDIGTASCLKLVRDEAAGGYSAVQFHPDGIILGMGTTNKMVRVWELRSQKSVAQFEGHAGAVTGVSFNENGYQLATAAADGVKLWDLRKLKNFKQLQPYDDASCTKVTYDHSGVYLMVGGADARVYNARQDCSLVTCFTDLPAKGGVSALLARRDARSFLVGASDHNLRLFGGAE